MSRVGFEPTISAGERPNTYALDRPATGTGINWLIPNRINIFKVWVEEILSIRQLWKEESVKMKHSNKGREEVEENDDFYDFFQNLRPRKVILDSAFCQYMIDSAWSIVLQLALYPGCPRRNVRDFGRVFLMLKYTDITQNTYVQSWTVTEIMAREVWHFDSCYTLIDYQIYIETGRNMWFL